MCNNIFNSFCIYIYFPNLTVYISFRLMFNLFSYIRTKNFVNRAIKYYSKGKTLVKLLPKWFLFFFKFFIFIFIIFYIYVLFLYIIWNCSLISKLTLPAILSQREYDQYNKNTSLSENYTFLIEPHIIAFYIPFSNFPDMCVEFPSTTQLLTFSYLVNQGVTLFGTR